MLELLKSQNPKNRIASLLIIEVLDLNTNHSLTRYRKLKKQISFNGGLT